MSLGIVRDVVSVLGWRLLHDAITGAFTVSLSVVSKLEAQYLLSFFFFFFNIETELLYSAVLVSAYKEVNQPHVQALRPASPHLLPTAPSRPSHTTLPGAEALGLCSGFPPAPCLTCSSVYMPRLLAQLIPHPFPSQVSLCMHLYSCPANRLISTIFLDSTYIRYLVLSF